MVGLAGMTAATSHQNPAIGLHRDTLACVIGISNRRRELPVPAECSVQAPVDVVANKGVVIVETVTEVSGHQDATVGLNRDARSHISGRAKVSGDKAVTTEAGIQAPVGVVANQCQVGITAAVAIAGDKDSAVRLQDNAAA